MFFHGFTYGYFYAVTDANILVLIENMYSLCIKYLRVCFILYYYNIFRKKIRL